MSRVEAIPWGVNPTVLKTIFKSPGKDAVIPT